MERVNLINDEVKNIRMRVIDGETWYVYKDICRELDRESLLGIPGINYNYDMLYSNFPMKSKGVLLTEYSTSADKVLALNKDGLATFILTLGLENENFKDFKDWISKEAIPVIMKEGSYEDSQTIINKFKLNLQKNLKEG
jgi:prophage antirepressor-like protein